MYWSCEICNEWGSSDSEVAAAVDRLEHLDAHRAAGLVPEPAEEEQSEDTVLNLKYAAWGITFVLGLLSTHWHAVAAVLPFAAVIAFVVTFTGE
ncbi:hypothetical protein PV336_16435 [Streptomyces sp. MI02-2A]|uniref:hypothetical protein n=1 Tax=Streptomyces sp. MI02-2A TaxID=3028688 RepID=UPI0029BC6CCD|nr:hypothetical protein [Streptomyces sp. MI02-2A]MDX3260806.1 hypothetical protein [Streptomyces sp. MI02-2A]